MSDESQETKWQETKTEIVEEFKKPNETSLRILKLIIDGYVRLELKPKLKENEMDYIVPYVINELFLKYYPKQLYMMILSTDWFGSLDITLCDTSRIDTKLTLNKIKCINNYDINDDINKIGKPNAGYCFKTSNEIIKNLSKKITNKLVNDKSCQYDVIFKVGGYARNKKCQIIFYPNNNINDYDNNNDKILYYSLPELPFMDNNNANFEFMNPVYSKKHGLIVLEYEKGQQDHIAILNINNDNNDELKWEMTMKNHIQQFLNIYIHQVIV